MGSNTALAKLIEVEKVETAKSSNRVDRALAKSDEPRKRKPKKLSRKKIQQLVIDHREHGRRLAWSFLSSWRIRMNQDEVMSVVGMALCEAANRFDVSKGVSFKTFFFYHLRGMLLKEITRVIQEQKVLHFVPASSDSEGMNSDYYFFSKGIFSLVENNNPEKIIQQRQVAGMVWEACAQLDSLEREVLVRCFVMDEPLIRIAKDLGYCRCHISRVKSRALAKLSKLLKELQQEKDEEVETGDDIMLPRSRSDASVRVTGYTGGRGRRRGQGRDKRSDSVIRLLSGSF